MRIIDASNVTKDYLIPEKRQGLKGTLRHFFARDNKIVTAVNSLNLQINSGEIVGFIGSNGAGKTTTLKMLCGLIHPSTGQINVAGHCPALRERRFLEKITLVMGQKQQLIWDLPPIESLKVNAAVYGLTDREASKRIDELASMLELNNELIRPVRKLSLGQRMKAELLASLLHRPSILFLDEPTLGLDINAQIRVREFLKEYNKNYGATILLTSHYMADISSLCKRVVLIDKGSVIHDGSLIKLSQVVSPTRSVSIELFEKIPRHNFLEFGEIIKYDGYLLEILISKSNLTEMLSRLLITFPIKDLEVKDPPIEQIIGKVLKSGKSYS